MRVIIDLEGLKRGPDFFILGGTHDGFNQP